MGRQESVPVQVRMDPDLHARVAEYARRMHCSRNAAYQALIERGIAAEQALERRQFPQQRVVNL